ncbi:MAG TPA: hypothetical protein VGJ25_09090 [Gaiellaceae bacterium]|jgi:hypothetical protein
MVLPVALRKHKQLALAAGVGLLLLFYLRSRGPSGIPIQTSTSPVDPTAADAAAGGGGSGGGDVAAALSGLSDAQTQNANQFAGLQSSLEAIAQAQQQLSDLWTYGQTPVDSWPGDPGISDRDMPPLEPSPAPAEVKKEPGFLWGGQRITTAKQLLSFESSHGNKGFSLGRWAAQHPAAAASIGVKPGTPGASKVVYTPPAGPRNPPSSPVPHVPQPPPVLKHALVGGGGTHAEFAAPKGAHIIFAFK